MKAVNAMSEEERNRSDMLQTAVKIAVDMSMADSERSQWTQDHKMGVSDIGGCREYLRRLISREPFSDEQDNFAAAFIGTAVGTLAEDAMVRAYPDYRSQLSVTVKLRIKNYEINLPGHPDLVGTDEVIDFKTVDGVSVVKRTGPTTKQWFQVVLYTKALIDMGEVPKDAWMSLVFIDRSGREPMPQAFSKRYSEDMLADIEEWFSDVVYAIENREEASKDMPRSWCWAACSYATNCRGLDTDVEGIIDDPVVIEAAAMYRKALDEMRALEKDKKSAASVMDGHSGVVDIDGTKHTLRWVSVGASEVPASTRQPYKKIDLRPVSGGKGKRTRKTDGEQQA